ncbi:hypothetical protein FACS1894202_13260 [Clostridia bacterium]|nr:hypothetical protein FACS1894202_13260 [Clostridia bacterium]
MAKSKVLLPNDYMKRLRKLEVGIDRIVASALKEGAEFLLPKLKAKMQTVIGHGTKYPSRTTGEMISSVGISPVKETRRGGQNVKIGLSEPRKKQVAPKKFHMNKKGRKIASRGYYEITNAMLANIIEFGRRKAGYNQPPKPMVKPVANANMDKCLNIMSVKLDKEVGSL